MSQWPMILEQLKQLIYTAPAALIAICMHEFSHGLVSYLLGDPTPKRDGRLSLNPLHHLDPAGTICMILFHFGWAKPVQVNPQYYRKPKAGMALTALAGPMCNFALAFLSVGLFCGLIHLGWPGDSAVQEYLFQLVQYVILMNIGLGLFNLVPVPPLDGSKIFGALLSNKLYAGMLRYERYGSLVLMALLLTGILDKPLAVASDFVLEMMLRVWF